MVTTSFTLRKTSVGFGSYNRAVADDVALRSDGFVSTTNALVGTSTFSANIINLNSILLSWDLSFSLVASSEDPAPTELVIVASTTGEPQTVKDGVFVFSTTSNSISSYSDSVRVEQGRWVYYSLFAKYSDFVSPVATQWYERLTSLYIQVPRSYNSINNLWSRIPEYYRNLDAAQEGQPLYNFLELFGWEMDRTRTLIDTIALSNDPDIAVTPALEQLAYQLGLETTIPAVGTTKIRKLLGSIGRIRKTKGTIESINYYINALTGCPVTYIYDAGTSNHIFKVHSQRVNFVKDPKFSQAITGSTTTTGASYMVANTVAPTWGVYSYGATTSTGASVSTDGSQLTVTNLSASDNITVFVYQRNEFPYYRPANLYTTFTPTLSAGASFTNFHIAETDAISFWESNYPPLSMPSDWFLDTWNTSKTELLPDSRFPSQKRYEITSNSASVNPINVFPVLAFSLDAGASIKVKDWLVEHFAPGEYFDGDTKEGGYIPTLAGSGIGTYDYRWAGTARESFSYYMLDYKRISEITEDIIKNYIAPVTIKDNVTLEWNYYYGKT